MLTFKAVTFSCIFPDFAFDIAVISEVSGTVVPCSCGTISQSALF